jgi:hypothetical protein
MSRAIRDALVSIGVTPTDLRPLASNLVRDHTFLSAVRALPAAGTPPTPIAPITDEASLLAALNHANGERVASLIADSAARGGAYGGVTTQLNALTAHATHGGALDAALRAHGGPVPVPTGGGAVAREFGDRAVLLDTGATGYLRTGSIGAHTNYTVPATGIDHTVFTEYSSLHDEAVGLFDASSSAARRTSTRPPSALDNVAEAIRNSVEQHERDMGLVEGTLPKKELDRIVKEHLRELKAQAGQAVTDMSAAVGAHKRAAAALTRDYQQWTRDLREATQAAVEANTAAMTAAHETPQAIRQAEEAIRRRASSLGNAMSAVHTRQMGVHSRALEGMEGIVETLAENGVKLKKNFNFKLEDKQVVEKVESAASKAESAAAEAAEHMPPKPPSHLMGIGIGAVAGATAAHFMKGDDNDSIMPEVFGAVGGGIVGRIVSGFRSGASVAMGAAGRVQELAPQLAENALRHGL